MFSMDIVSSDAFLDMPTSSRELYFQLGMYADDEGFVNPKKILRMTGAGDDDLKILTAKRFILPFESGVVVIKHWLIHNTIRMDRFNPTQYTDEKNMLELKENKAYTELATTRQPNGNRVVPQVKLSEVNLIEVNSEERDGIEKPIPTPKQEATEFFASRDLPYETVKWLIDKGIPEKVAIDELFKFINYWSELNATGKKMKWQLQATFELHRRLATWFSRVAGFGKKETVNIRKRTIA